MDNYPYDPYGWQALAAAGGGVWSGIVSAHHLSDEWPDALLVAADALFEATGEEVYVDGLKWLREVKARPAGYCGRTRIVDRTSSGLDRAEETRRCETQGFGWFMGVQPSGDPFGNYLPGQFYDLPIWPSFRDYVGREFCKLGWHLVLTEPIGGWKMTPGEAVAALLGVWAAAGEPFRKQMWGVVLDGTFPRNKP